VSRVRIVLLSLGGTIAMVPGDGGLVPALTGADLVRSVPQLAEVAELEAVAFRQMPGASLTLTDVAALADEIRRRVRAGAGGVVVTQGTDTLEETAFALDLLLDVGVPAVVTGAMRPPSAPGSDAAANLLGAVLVAADARVARLGVVVVMGDQVHAARFVRKEHTSSPAAFVSSAGGPLGYLSEEQVVLVARPFAPSPTLEQPDGAEDPPVALVAVGLGDDGRLVRGLAGAGYRGAVVEAVGGGHVPERMAGDLGALTAAMPVVLAARARSGRVLTHTYGFPGSETDLLRRGLIPSGTLDAVKSRILLSLLLRCAATPTQIRTAFRAYG
jgi:L-asparaginase